MAGAFGDRPPVRTSQLLELARATDERRVEPAPEARALAVDFDEPPRVHGLGLSLGGDRLEPLVARRVVRERLRRAPDDDFFRTCGFLEALRDVDGVAGDQRADAVAGHDLTGVDADPNDQPDTPLALELVAETFRVAAELVRGANGADRVVFVELRHAEHGHDSVADELLHGAPVALDHLAGDLEPARERAAHRLGIQPLSESGRIGHVREEDGDRLARDGHRLSLGRLLERD